MKGIITLSFLACFYITGSAQTASLTIGKATVCAEQEVFVPVQALNLYDLAAITLYIGFDPGKLDFIDLVNIHPALAGMSYSLNTSPVTKIGIAWSNLNPAQFLNEKLFDIKFLTKNETTDIVFNPGCQLANINLLIINTSYTNGEVLSETPVIMQHPTGQHVKAGADVSFSVNSSNSSGYRWSESTDNGNSWNELNENSSYAGVESDELTIHHVEKSFNGNRYKCKVFSNNCTLESTDALLTIDSLNSINDKSVNGISQILVSPNPISGRARMKFTIAEPGKFNCAILDCLGNQIQIIDSYFTSAGLKEVLIDMTSEKAGIYFYRVSFTAVNNHSLKSGKILRCEP